MDRSKWILAMGIAAMMLAVGISLPTDASGDDDVISLDTGAYDDGKQQYSIGTADGLKKLAGLVNEGKTFEEKTVFLTNDIALSGEWTPIGNGSRDGRTFTGNYFAGTFDGNDYVITGLTISSTGTSAPTGNGTAGLFGVVKGGTVKNVILDKISITSQNKNAGAVAGLLCGGGTIERCVAGLSVGTENTISVAQGAGGIVGRVVVSGTVSYCQNLTAASGERNCGGIAGIAYYTESDKKIVIDHCTNYAGIESTVGYVGGITGLSSAFIEDCVNAGNISSKGASTGGIVGEQKAYGWVKSCKNFGNVNSVTSGDQYGVGGVVGWIRYSDETDEKGPCYPVQDMIYISGCVNYGDVISTGNCAGGIIGMTYTWAYIDGNTNLAGKIEAVTFASGITSYQTTETYGHGKQGLTIVDNVSITTGLKAGCTDGIIYTNGNNVESHHNAGTLPDDFVREDEPTPYIVSRSQTPTVSITVSREKTGGADEITLTANVTNNVDGIVYTFLWGSSEADSSITVTKGGDYSVTVTISDGIRTFSGTNVCKVSGSGTTTTTTEEPDGTKITVTENSDGSKVTATETTEVKEIGGQEMEISTIVTETKDGVETKTESKASVVVVSDESKSASVSDAVVKALVDTVAATLQESKTVSVTSKDATEVSISGTAIGTISSSGVALEFVGSAGTLTADTDVVKTFASKGDSLTISFVKTEDIVLPDTQQKVEKPTAYVLSVTRSDGTSVHELNGTVDLTVEYKHPANVSAGEVVVIYVADNGRMEAMTTEYDPDSEILKFSTDHFSYFMVGTRSMLPSDHRFPVLMPDEDQFVPPVIYDRVTDSDSGEDAKTIACVAAVVVIVVMLLFLVRDTRTK